MILAEETVIELLKSWPHWAFELISGAAYAAIGAVFGRIWIKRHDLKHHNHDCKEGHEGPLELEDEAKPYFSDWKPGEMGPIS